MVPAGARDQSDPLGLVDLDKGDDLLQVEGRWRRPVGRQEPNSLADCLHPRRRRQPAASSECMAAAPDRGEREDGNRRGAGADDDDGDRRSSQAADDSGSRAEGGRHKGADSQRVGVVELIGIAHGQWTYGFDAAGSVGTAEDRKVPDASPAAPDDSLEGAVIVEGLPVVPGSGSTSTWPPLGTVSW